MAKQPITIGVQSNPGRDPAAGAARLINCYAEDAGDEAKIRFPIYASDGLESFATLTGGGAIRAMLAYSSTAAYVVSGTKVYKVTTSGGTVAALTGTLPATGVVTIVRNRKEPNAQVGISVGGEFWVLDTTADTLAEVDLTSLGTGNLVWIEGLDGYFILYFDNGEFFITGIDDAATIDPLDFAKAESHPDGLVAGAKWGRDIVLFGSNSMEFWQNTGASPFPLERTAATSIGCYAAGSVAEVVIVRPGAGATDNVIWAATEADGAYAGVMMLNGYSGTKISTLAVDRAITAESDPANISATKWTRDGHVFYAISGTNFTWVYDTSTGFWHERVSATETRWRISQVIAFAGTNIAGDFEAATLYDMNPDAYDEAGTAMTMTVIPPAVHAYPQKLRFYALYVDTIPGVGLASGDAADTNPTITMSHSNDNGNTWSTGRAKYIGQATEKSKRVKWLQIGQSQEDGKLFKLTMSAKVFKGITGMAVDFAQAEA